MSTNFFNQIAQMQITGDLHLTITKGAENSLVVSVMLQNSGCGDNAKNIIPPLNLRGTADQLDSGFFENITSPMQTASGLMVDMEAFMKQMEEAKRQSAMEKEKGDRQKKEQEAKEKKYKDAMLKADQLEKEHRFREAWLKVPEITEFPERADEIRRRKKELSDKFTTPNLFGTLEDEKPVLAETAQLNGDAFNKESETEQ